MTTRYWLGAAVPIPEVKTYLFSGTWNGGDTAWIEINGKRLTLTLTTGDTLTTVAINAAFIDMINGDSANENEVRSALGTSVGEYLNIEASTGATTSTLKLIGYSTGQPMGTVTVGCLTASDGDFVAIGGGADVTGTGPNYFDNGYNWSGSAIPTDGDDIVFDHQSAADCLYNLEPSSLTPTSLTVTSGFRYAIGLAEVNKDSTSYPYNEHRPTYLKLDGGGTVTIDGSGAAAIKLDFGTTATTIIINGTGTTAESGTPPCLIKANHSDHTLTVTSGSVGLNVDSKLLGEVGTAYIGGTMTPTLDIGDTTAVTTLNINNASVVHRGTSVTVALRNGTLEYHGSAITTLNVDGGTCYLMSSATITSGTITAGTIDASKDSRSRTFSGLSVYPNSTIKDPAGTITFTTGINCYAKPDEVTWDFPPRRTYSLAAI